MTRPLAVVALLALPAVASAQMSRELPAGPYGSFVWTLGNNQVIDGPPITDGVSYLYPVVTLGGGLPRTWVPAGIWGGVYYTVEYAPVIPLVPFEEPIVRPRPRERERTTPPIRTAPVTISGLSSASLVVQFPATAEVWVSGKKVNGDAVAERPQLSPTLIAAEASSRPTELTLTSPALKLGESHTFEVRGRWTVGGKTFEYQRSVTVRAGDRSRSVVISGTEVKE